MSIDNVENAIDILDKYEITSDNQKYRIIFKDPADTVPTERTKIVFGDTALQDALDELKRKNCIVTNTFDY